MKQKVAVQEFSKETLNTARARITAELVRRNPTGLTPQELSDFCMRLDLGRYDNLSGNTKKSIIAGSMQLENGSWVNRKAYRAWERSVAKKKNGDTVTTQQPAPTVATRTHQTDKTHTFEGDLKVTIEGDGLTVSAKVKRVAITLITTVVVFVAISLVF